MWKSLEGVEMIERIFSSFNGNNGVQYIIEELPTKKFPDVLRLLTERILEEDPTFYLFGMKNNFLHYNYEKSLFTFFLFFF